MNLYSIAITLLLIMDPFGNIPYFLSTLSHVKRERQFRIILREMLIALFILFLFLFFGRYMLEGLGLSSASLSIAGGVILFIISLQMIFGRYHTEEREQPSEEPLIVPLAVPMIAGPSAMTLIILLSTQYPNDHDKLALALLGAWGVSTVILAGSGWLAKFLEKRILKAIEKLMGMVLTALAVQILLQGLTLYFNAK